MKGNNNSELRFNVIAFSETNFILNKRPSLAFLFYIVGLLHFFSSPSVKLAL